MKVIDLLNKIANGEEVPKKVKYKTFYWKYSEKDRDYKDTDEDYVFSCSNYNIPAMLNREVEIIEENTKIEKLGWVDYNVEFTHKDFNKEFRNIANKIDEIIDKLNEMENNNE